MDLDEFQKEIVESDYPRIIVEAGAGSGKTRVLIERIKRLLKNGIEPQNIIAITFTNMAAEEMKERMKDIPNSGDCFIGTIHSFANKIFKTSGKEYKIYTEEIENQFMENLIMLYAKHLTFNRFLEIKKLKKQVDLGIINNIQFDSLVMPDEYHEMNKLMGRITNDDYKDTVYTLCKKANVLTFDELLEKTTEYFKEINGKVEYLFVDEFQDIGPLENNFFKSLNAENYFYVGDEKQSLYAFKGSDVKYFTNLISNPNWKAYFLKNNYRSGRKIIDIATIVIKQASGIINFENICKSNNMGEVIVDVKSNLEYHLERITNFKDWFILVRTNKEIYEMEQKLIFLGIPFITFKRSELDLSQMREKLEENSVKLLTVHSSKGLESKNVLLYGNFPVRQKPYLINSDERKVMYVGCTRAINKLIILN